MYPDVHISIIPLNALKPQSVVVIRLVIMKEIMNILKQWIKVYLCINKYVYK